MDVDPHRGMLLVEVARKLRVRHQVEPHELHGTVLPKLGGLGKRSFTGAEGAKNNSLVQRVIIRGLRNIIVFPALILFQIVFCALQSR
jgi:hypothetical protein